MGTKNDAPTLGKDPTAGDQASNAPVPAPAAPPAKTADQEIAELRAQLAAKDATIEKLTDLATRPDSDGDDIASMTDAPSSRTVRPEHGSIPLHFTTGEPVFNANRPTGKGG